MTDFGDIVAFNNVWKKPGWQVLLCSYPDYFRFGLKVIPLILILLSLGHAAVIAINEAIDRGQAEATFRALINPNARLLNTQDVLCQEYQDILSQAKRSKEKQASGTVMKGFAAEMEKVLQSLNALSPSLCSVYSAC